MELRISEGSGMKFGQLQSELPLQGHLANIR